MISFKAITPRKIMGEYEASEKHAAPFFYESVITQHHPIKASPLTDHLSVVIDLFHSPTLMHNSFIL
jgi:hypothetical protein